MFSIKINGKSYKWFNGFTVDLNYNSVASKFSFNGLFESSNMEHRELFKPFSYNDIEIYYGKKLLITGTILNVVFTSKKDKTLAKVEGYSKTGVINDCNLPKDSFPLTISKSSSKDAIERVLKPFNLSVIIDESAIDLMNEVEDEITVAIDESIATFIARLCLGKGLILTHNAFGQLVITKLSVPKGVVQRFDDTEPSISMVMKTNGQGMFSEVYSVKEQGFSLEKVSEGDFDSSGAEDGILIPYVNATRPRTYMETTGNNKDLALSNRKKVGALIKKAVTLTISCDTIKFLNGEVFTPNEVISVKSNDIYLLKDTEFFIEKVALKQGDSNDSAILSCVLLTAYNEDDLIDIFA